MQLQTAAARPAATHLINATTLTGAVVYLIARPEGIPLAATLGLLAAASVPLLVYG